MKYGDLLSHLDTILERDRRMDRQMDRIAMSVLHMKKNNCCKILNILYMKFVNDNFKLMLYSVCNHIQFCFYSDFMN